MSLSARPLLLGHRGASKYATENTRQAFDLALQHGCDGFEFDVRYTRDRRCVVCHDSVHQRKRIAVRRFDEFELPSADEVIRDYSTRAFLDVELKVPGDAGAIAQALTESARDARCIVSSFQPEVLRTFSLLAPKIPLGLICENVRQLKAWPKLPVNGLMIHFSLVSEPLIDELHRAGRRIFVWTVNKRSEMRHFASLGVDGIISDDTRLLASTLPRS